MGPKRRLNCTSKVNTQTHRQTNIWTNRLIERGGQGEVWAMLKVSMFSFYSYAGSGGHFSDRTNGSWWRIEWLVYCHHCQCSPLPQAAHPGGEEDEEPPQQRLQSPDSLRPSGLQCACSLKLSASFKWSQSVEYTSQFICDLHWELLLINPRQYTFTRV